MARRRSDTKSNLLRSLARRIETSNARRVAAIKAFPGCLVITQSQHVHEEIAELLGQLELFETSAGRLRKDSEYGD